MAHGVRSKLGVGLALVLAGQVPTGAARAAIDAAQASRIALDRVPGTVEHVARGREIRWEVFVVDVLGNDGVKYEVVLDARDGGILWANPST